MKTIFFRVNYIYFLMFLQAKLVIITYFSVQICIISGHRLTCALPNTHKPIPAIGLTHPDMFQHREHLVWYCTAIWRRRQPSTVAWNRCCSGCIRRPHPLTNGVRNHYLSDETLQTVYGDVHWTNDLEIDWWVLLVVNIKI